MSDDEAPDPAAIEAAQLALLLAPPSEADEIAHYASVLAPGAPGHGNVTVKRVKHGKGLVAAAKTTTPRGYRRAAAECAAAGNEVVEWS